MALIEKTWAAAVRAQLERQEHPCRVCGEYLTIDGRTCKRCEASLEEERLDKEARGL